MIMRLKRREIKKSGQSYSITLSNEFLERIGAKEGDTVIVDEEKLVQFIMLENQNLALDKKIDSVMEQVFNDHYGTFEELVEK